MPNEKKMKCSNMKKGPYFQAIQKKKQKKNEAEKSETHRKYTLRVAVNKLTLKPNE